MGSGSPSDELLQCRSPSRPQPFSGSIPCYSVGFSTRCIQNFSPPVISENCRGSACHFTTGQRKIAAPDCLPTYFFTNLGVCTAVSFSPTPLENKRELPKQKVPLAQQVSPLKYVYRGGTDCLNLDWKWSQLGARGALLKASYRGTYTSSTLFHCQNPTRQTQHRLGVK